MKATPDDLKYFSGLCVKGECSERCPYYECESCVEKMLADALACIEQLESRVEPKNRVLTLEEVAKSEVMWYEDRLRTGVLLVIRGCGRCEPDFTKLVGPWGYEFYRKNVFYNDFWRCWLRKPTEAERRETPWEGDSRE